MKSSRWIPALAAAIAVTAAFVVTSLLPRNSNVKAAAPAEAARVESVDETALTRLGIAMLAIASLGGGTIWLVRRMKSVPFSMKKRQRNLEVLDVMSLGGKRSLTVARVYDRVLVLGITDQHVSLVTQINDEEAQLDTEVLAAAAPAQPNGTELFKSLLNKVAKQKVLTPAPQRRANATREYGDEVTATAARESVEDLL